MSTSVKLELEDDLATLLYGLNQPVEVAARELIVLEVFRRGLISSGKAAQLLGMPRWEFVSHASRLGIAFFELTADEWQAEKARAETL